MKSKFFPQTKCFALTFAALIGSGICLLAQNEQDLEPEASPEPSPTPGKNEVGYIRLLLNAPGQNSLAVTVASRELEEPEVLFDGPGRLYVGGYFEIPAGRCSVVYRVGDRDVATSEITIGDKEFYTVNLLFPQRGNNLVIEKDAPSEAEQVTQRFRVFNFTGPEFRTALQVAGAPSTELARNEVQMLSVPEGTHSIEVFVTKPATQEFGKVVAEGQFAKGQSLTMILFNDYRNKVSSRMFFDGVLD